jgi:hypothetical protein
MHEGNRGKEIKEPHYKKNLKPVIQRSHRQRINKQAAIQSGTIRYVKIDIVSRGQMVNIAKRILSNQFSVSIFDNAIKSSTAYTDNWFLTSRNQRKPMRRKTH